MNILFEDKFLVVCEKEPGVASQGDPSGRDDMVKLLQKECSSDIFCVHRLDTPTGGIMVYAKDQKTAGRLTASLADGSCRKRYLCAFRAEDIDDGEMEDFLYHDKRLNKAFVATKERKGVKKASLSYKILEKKDGIALACVTLHTGRTHQIRVQFSSRGFPLLGDGKYGSRDKCPLALRCFNLSFIHPITKKPLSFTLLPPAPWFGFDLEEITE